MWETLPADILEQIPLDGPALAALACTSRRMRDAVAEVRCWRGVSVRSNMLGFLKADRYAGLTTLTVVDSHAEEVAVPLCTEPVPRLMPKLRSLDIRGCRATDFIDWDLVFGRAPELRHVLIDPQGYVRGNKFKPHTRGVMNMLRSHGARRLTSLEIRKTTEGYRFCYDRAVEAYIADRTVGVDGTAKTDEQFEMPELRRLVVRGGAAIAYDFAPTILAPKLEHVDLDESHVAVRLRGLDLRGVRELVWRTPRQYLPLPSGLDELRALTLVVGCVADPPHFMSALATLTSVPVGVTMLDVRFGYFTSISDIKSLPVAPLRHLVRLRELSIELARSFAGIGDLVMGLLGVPETAPLQKVHIEAAHTPAAALVRAWDWHFSTGVDPDEPLMRELAARIDHLESLCAVPAEAVGVALDAHPAALITLTNFTLSAKFSHPRFELIDV